MSQKHRSVLKSALGSMLLSFACGAFGNAHAADPAYGQYLSSECVTCHRADGQDKGIPAIVGWPADQFVAALKSYKDKDRDNQIMQTIAGRLSDDEMAALAAYYGSLKPAQ